MEEKFLWKEHIEYVLNLDKDEESKFEHIITDHLRMNAIYWALCCLDLLGKKEGLPKDDLLKFIKACHNEDGGFSGNIGHDSHLLYTLSAIQILAILDSLDQVDKEKVSKYVKSLLQKDGSVSGDKWGEIDTRFSYCAVNCLSLLGKLDQEISDQIVGYVLKCQNFDGGFGVNIRAESHAGQIFCCVGVLSITNNLDKIDIDKLCWWLCERQVKENGGLNGRPEKLADVCYSWWVLSSLCMCDRLDWISKQALEKFIIDCQDEKGGISDKPGNMVDVFHTYFGVGGLSLMKSLKGLKTIDPTYALPVDVLIKLGISTPYTKRYSF